MSKKFSKTALTEEKSANPGKLSRMQNGTFLPKREVISDDRIDRDCEDFLKKKMEPESKWSEWHHALSPEVCGNWFSRDEESLSTKNLPCHVGGIYEIAVSRTIASTEPVYVIYAGAATKVRKDVKGISLRGRLYSNYASNGSHINVQLRAFLQAGFHIYFRWVILHHVKTCGELESLLMAKYDYAFCTELNLPQRDPEKVYFSDEKENLYSLLVTELDKRKSSNPAFAQVLKLVKAFSPQDLEALKAILDHLH